MKPLVPALDAQSGVGAGGKAFSFRLQGEFQWHGTNDPAAVGDLLLCFAGLPLGTLTEYETGLNLQCGEVSAKALKAVCRVACLEWNMRIRELRTPNHGRGWGDIAH